MVPTGHDRRGLAWLIGWCGLVVVFAIPASARPGDDPSALSRGQFTDLVSRSSHDERAMAALRRVRSVDGQPVDLEVALRGAGTRLAQVRVRRLARLVGSSGPASGTANRGAISARAREDAARVLARDKFRTRSVPRPFRGILRWIGDRLSPVLDPISRFIAELLASGAGQLALLALVIAVASFVAYRLVGGRSRAAAVREAHRPSRLVDPAADPEALDRRAAAAEDAGHHDAAVRLRYQAGVVRLDRSGMIELRPDTTTGDVARQVRSPVLDELTVAFDEIVYGGRPAGPADSTAARQGWTSVLAAPVIR